MLSDCIYWRSIWASAVSASVGHGVSNVYTPSELRAFNRRMTRLAGASFIDYRAIG
ncbi:MAG: hypothetical protein PVG82_02520 [Chromatiales bacterium]|jgi:hypothetical protein